MFILFIFFFFFSSRRRHTRYWRDWSSDVCSSDLFKTIIDANVVTLITAAILILVATSSVKGFAIMLFIGVCASIFTAVVFTRAMLGLLAGFTFMSSTRVLGHLGSGDRWKRFDFIGRTKLW